MHNFYKGDKEVLTMKIVAGMPWRLDWEISGLAKRIRGCFKAISNLGVEINLHCLGPEIKENNFSTACLQVKTTAADVFSPLINSIAFSHEFSKRVEREEYEVLHCFNTASFFLTDKKYLFQTVNPTYAFVLDIMSEEYPKTRKYQKKLTYYKSIAEIERIEYQNADHIVASSELIKENIIKYHEIEKSKIEVIPSGVSPSECNFKREKRGDIKIILFPGTVRIMKGFHYLVEAMDEVKKEFPHCVLLAAGRILGAEHDLFKKALEEMRERGIFLTGFLPREKLFRYYHLADVCCLPSLFDDMSMSILESVANGLPIVATRNTGFPEIEKVGIEIPPKNPEAISEGIITLLSDPELLRKKSENAKKVIKNYYWDKIAERFTKLYKGF